MRNLTPREEATLRIINTNPHGTMNHLAYNATSTPKPKKRKKKSKPTGG